MATREEAVRLAVAVRDYEHDGIDPPICIRCKSEYTIEYDRKPGPLCDRCAHVVVNEFAKALLVRDK